MSSQPTELPTSTLSPADVLIEPVPGAFITRYSTPECRKIAFDGLIYLTEVGSTLHGVSTDSTNDDIDEMGICIEPPTHVIGTAEFSQYEYRTQPVNHRSHAGDIDRNVYSLRKYVRLCAQGNPTMLMPLFAPDDKVRFSHEIGRVLVLSRDMMLSKAAGERFLGYLDSQIKRYLDPDRTDSTHTARPELVQAYGWDTKTGYHALRLAIQGTQLMTTGSIKLPMTEANRKFLLKVRNGQYTKGSILQALADTYIPKLVESIKDSDLPEDPDWEQINSWLSYMYVRFWREKGWI